MSDKYRALTLESMGGPFVIREMDALPPKTGEAVVRLRAAAFNHRDLWIQKGQYAGLKFPCVVGSDGSGIVEAVGEGVDAAWVGKKVMINPSLDWGPAPWPALEAQGKNFRILGLPDAGTFAERITVPAANLAAMPGHLSFEEAAALPLAGLTGYRALFTRGRVQRGEKLLVTGIGGGVALMIFGFARAAGVNVYVTSGSAEKLARARAMGAQGGANYREADWAEKLAAEAGPFDCIIDSAGGPGFSQLCDLARSGGRLVFFGATAGNPPEIALRKIFWRQLSLLGSTMGSPEEFTAMTEQVRGEGIRPVIDQVFSFAEANKALQRMDAGGQFGKIVLTI